MNTYQVELAYYFGARTPFWLALAGVLVGALLRVAL